MELSLSEALKLSVVRLGNAQVKVDVEVPQETVNKAFHKAYQDINARVKIKGFRSGKIPVDFIKKRFFENVKGEVCESLMNNSLQKAIREHSLTIIGKPQIENISKVLEACNEELALSFTLLIEENPKVKLASYKNLRVDLNHYVYTQKHIDFQLDSMRYKSLELKEKVGEVGSEDVVQLQYHFYLVAPDESLNELYRLDIGQKDALFEEYKSHLLGMQVGESANIPSTIPQGYKIENICGKSGHLFVKILNIFSKILPNIDDEFAKDYQFDSITQLREYLEENLKKLCEQKRQQDLYNSCIEKLIHKSSFEIGTNFIHDHVEQSVKDIITQLQKENYTLDQYLQEMNLKTIDDLKTRLMKNVERNMQHQLVREAIIQAEDLTVSESDLNTLITEDAKEKNMTFQELKAQLHKTKQLENLFQNILTDLILKCLSQYTHIEEKGELPLFSLENNSKI